MSACDGKAICDESDNCYKAVVNAYTQLKRLGQRDEICFKSAVTVYRHHHPEVPPQRAPFVIAEWLAGA